MTRLIDATELKINILSMCDFEGKDITDLNEKDKLMLAVIEAIDKARTVEKENTYEIN